MEASRLSRVCIRTVTKSHLAHAASSTKRQSALTSRMSSIARQGPPLGQAAHHTADVLPRWSRPRGNRIKRRRGPTPDWSLNLQQNPRAVVKIGTNKLTLQARTASPEERPRLWVGITATYSGYARYQEKTARQIPVLILRLER
jgi:deazaflavin-dependent oxidoreductase (nitroreductase family)